MEIFKTINKSLELCIKHKKIFLGIQQWLRKKKNNKGGEKQKENNKTQKALEGVSKIAHRDIKKNKSLQILSATKLLVMKKKNIPKK